MPPATPEGAVGGALRRAPRGACSCGCTSAGAFQYLELHMQNTIRGVTTSSAVAQHDVVMTWYSMSCTTPSVDDVIHHMVVPHPRSLPLPCSACTGAWACGPAQRVLSTQPSSQRGLRTQTGGSTCCALYFTSGALCTHRCTTCVPPVYAHHVLYVHTLLVYTPCGSTLQDTLQEGIPPYIPP